MESVLKPAVEEVARIRAQKELRKASAEFALERRLKSKNAIPKNVLVFVLIFESKLVISGNLSDAVYYKSGILIFFEFIQAIHCEWDEWVNGDCSKTCGTGTRTNTRNKSVVEEHGGTCSGEPIEFEECNTQECPGIFYW